jgi:hypothetical protein
MWHLDAYLKMWIRIRLEKTRKREKCDSRTGYDRLPIASTDTYLFEWSYKQAIKESQNLRAMLVEIFSPPGTGTGVPDL